MARASGVQRTAKNAVKVVGLTGGIASGKTTVVGELRRLGAKVIDADRVSRMLMQPGSVLGKKIIAAFGTAILKKGNTIDRKRLAVIVFSSRAKRRTLEKITHPAILREIRKKVASLKQGRGIRVVVIDAPLLFETGLDREVDSTVVVWVPAEVQLERLCRRDGLSRNEADRRIAAQWPLDAKKRRAAFAIDNSGTRGEMRRRVKKLWGVLTNNLN